MANTVRGKSNFKVDVIFNELRDVINFLYFRPEF